MLFDSQSKADNFLKFNAKEILEENETSPVRSYYCTFCCGWHVTSNPSTVQGEWLDGRDKVLLKKIEFQRKNNDELQAISKRVTNKILRFDTELNLCNFIEAQDVLDLLEFEVNELREKPFNLSKVNKIFMKIHDAEKRLNRKMELFSMSKEEQKAWLDLENPTKEELKIIGSITCWRN